MGRLFSVSECYDGPDSSHRSKGSGTHMQKTQFVTQVPGVMGGYPIISGTRTPVRAIVELYYDLHPGDMDEVQDALQHLSRKEIEAALEYYRDYPELVDEDIARQKAVLEAFIAASE